MRCNDIVLHNANVRDRVASRLQSMAVIVSSVSYICNSKYRWHMTKHSHFSLHTEHCGPLPNTSAALVATHSPRLRFTLRMGEIIRFCAILPIYFGFGITDAHKPDPHSAVMFFCSDTLGAGCLFVFPAFEMLFTFGCICLHFLKMGSKSAADGNPFSHFCATSVPHKSLGRSLSLSLCVRFCRLCAFQICVCIISCFPLCQVQYLMSSLNFN